MRIDRTHKPWAIATGVLLAVAAAIYVPYALGPTPPTGGSALGLGYGVAGFAIMAFAALLSVRKKLRIWRAGRAKTWMRGHLWLGALSLPLILFHAGFHVGHGLTSILMWMFLVVWTSGIVGAWLQHTLPGRLLREVSMETIFDEIAHVRAQLLDEADTVVADACGKLEVSRSAAAGAVSSGATALASVMRPVSSEAEDTGALRDFYMTRMRPFLKTPSRTHPLADAPQAAARFGALRRDVRAPFEPAIRDLESICEEERQLLRQERLHHMLHGWLIVHVPLSFALMALAVVHIFMALRF